MVFRNPPEIKKPPVLKTGGFVFATLRARLRRPRPRKEEEKKKAEEKLRGWALGANP